MDAYFFSYSYSFIFKYWLSILLGFFFKIIFQLLFLHALKQKKKFEMNLRISSHF